eukprot:UN27271
MKACLNANRVKFGSITSVQRMDLTLEIQCAVNKINHIYLQYVCISMSQLFQLGCSFGLTLLG